MDEEMFARLEAAILNDGRSKSRIALDAGFGRNYVQQLLLNKKMPKFDSLLKLCDELRIPLAYIMFGENMTPEDEELAARVRALPLEKQRLLRSLLDALDRE